MKKILAIIIAAVMIAACTVTAFAETTNVSYNVDPSYTVSIPAAVTLGDSAVLPTPPPARPSTQRTATLPLPTPSPATAQSR